MLILLGKKSNPYPFFLQVDLIAVLSYYEGLCGVVNEAKILEKPLIATEFSGINEQINNYVNGIIVQNNHEAIIKEMSSILSNRKFIDKMQLNGLPEEIQNDTLKIKLFKSLLE